MLFSPNVSSDGKFISNAEYVRKECAKIVAVCKAMSNYDKTQVEYVVRFKDKFKELEKELEIYLSYNIFNPNDSLDKLIRKDYETMLKYFKNSTFYMSELIEAY